MLHFKHLDVQEGLPSNRVYSLHIDSLGLIWVATGKGLASFDGRKFTKYTTESGLPSNIYYDFLEYPKGGFFALGENGKTIYFRRGEIKNIPSHDSIHDTKGGYFTHLHVFKDKARARFTQKHYEFTPDSTILLTKNSGNHMHNEVTGICSLELKSGETWFFHLDQKKKTITVTNSSVSENVTYLSSKQDLGIDKCPIQVSLEEAVFFHDKTLYIINFKQGKIKELQNFNSRIECARIDPNGKLWIGTIGDGLWYSEDLQQWQRRSQKLSVTDIEFTNKDELWISTLRNGLYYCPLITLETIFKGQYEQVHVEKDELCLATGHQFLMFDIASRVRLYEFSTDAIAISAHYDRFSNRWLLGGNNSKLYEVDSNFSVTTHSSLSNQYFRGFSTNKQYTIASLGVGYLLGRRRNMWNLDSFDLIGDERYSEIVLDELTNLYYSGSKGTFRYLINSGETEKLTEARSEKILFTENGNIILGTNKSGIQILNSDFKLIAHIDRESGLSSNQIFDIASYDSCLYVIHADGMSIVRNNGEAYDILNYPELTSIIADLSYVSIWKNFVILGNQLEVVKFPLSSLTRRKKPQFKIRLSTRSIPEVNIINNQQIPYDNQGIEAVITYASFESRKGYPMRYRTRSDDPWTEFYEEFTINNIQPGFHDMQIEYQDHSGNWAPIMQGSFGFEVMSPFWTRAWFLILVGLGCIFLIIVGARQFYIYKLISVEADLELKNQLRELQLRVIKAQLNPHFIFNVMTSAQYYLARNDVKKAQAFLVRFSRLVRRILEHSEYTNVTVKQELDMIANYVSIESERIGGEPISFHVFTHDNTLNRALITPSILQPFIENSIWHGLRSKNGTRTIIIRITSEDKELIISIEDNGIGRKAAKRLNGKKRHKSFGMRLSSDRIKLLSLSNKSQKIEIQDLRNPTGTVVIIRFPLVIEDLKDDRINIR
ncbi:MAG: histidine kinase [Salibacteraceae bacterium]